MRTYRILGAIVAVVAVAFGVLPAAALNWDEITNSGKYYYGVGHGATSADAYEQAKAQIAGSIVSNVSSSFVFENDEKRSMNEVERRSKVEMRVNTYSSATLTNLQKWEEVGKAPDITVSLYIAKEEVEKAFEARKNYAKSLATNAAKFHETRFLDMALQYYYWSYSLIKSLQNPYELKDDDGNLLLTSIKMKIEGILCNISVEFEGRSGDRVNLLFKYKGEPINSLAFFYNDGRSDDCEGTVKDGRGMLEMAPNYTTETYHLTVDYMGLSQVTGDASVNPVLSAMPRETFARAALKVNDNGQQSKAAEPVKNTVQAVQTPAPGSSDNSQSSSTPDFAACAKTVETVVNSFITHNRLAADTCFTIEGFKRYYALLRYGNARVIGEPNIKYYKTQDGYVVSRGLRMSFSFRGRVKKTFVEDVVFTLDRNAKIDNVTFGLGEIAENDILNKDAKGWNDATREMLLEFMENYKTAYCLKDSVYIRNIFADDATIIVGRVVRKRQFVDPEQNMSDRGKEVIHYNRFTKDQYLRNLRRSFDSNEFINIRFTRNDIQWLEKYDKERLFAIQIGQEYRSSTYGDKGYLFLLVDMTDPETPLIKVRTWQPNEVDISKLYNAGDFRND